MNVEVFEPLMVKIPFLELKEKLEDVPNVEMVTAGTSPATIRYLTNKNKIVNVGIEEVDDSTCEILSNNNSFELGRDELLQAHTEITKHLTSLKEAK